jgi:hypothetical protein
MTPEQRWLRIVALAALPWCLLLLACLLVGWWFG